MLPIDLLRKSRGALRGRVGIALPSPPVSVRSIQKNCVIAIFHASTKPVSRSSGRSAIASAASRAGVLPLDQRFATPKVHDYTRRSGVPSSVLIAPDGGALDREALWNAAEVAEKRKDARTAREWVLTLPAELDDAQRVLLVRSFGQQLAERCGVAVDVAIHAPDKAGDQRNHHAHVLTTTRQVTRDASGAIVLGEKADIELSDTRRRALGLGEAAVEVRQIRLLWEQVANAALADAGSAARIDRRTLAAQGVDREPTIHLGVRITAMERADRRWASDRSTQNRAIGQDNVERGALAARVVELKAERDRRAAAEAKPSAAMTLDERIAAERERLFVLEEAQGRPRGHVAYRLMASAQNWSSAIPR